MRISVKLRCGISAYWNIWEILGEDKALVDKKQARGKNEKSIKGKKLALVEKVFAEEIEKKKSQDDWTNRHILEQINREEKRT